MKKRFLCLTLGLILTFSQVATVSASSRKDELKQQKAVVQSQLQEQESKINSLETQKTAITNEINELDSNLVDVLVEIDILSGELTNKEAEIEQTKADLAVAEADRDAQYADMKKRIQYLYEKGGDNAWAQMLLQAEDLTSMLNQAEYVQQLYESDRTSLENFKATVQQVSDLGDQLESEKADLEIMQQEYQTQQANLETQLTEKKATSSDYDNQIATAQSQASQYAELIRQQNAEIQKIEEEEKRAAEEAARKAAEEAARKAAEEQAARDAAAKEAAAQQKAASSSKTNNTASANSGTTSSNSGSNSGSTNTGSSSNNSTGSSNTGSSSGSGSSSNTGSSSDSGSSSGSSESSGGAAYNPTGQSVINYACQFVGNPYVWGGTSLTGGADCSGFIMSVYAKFGVSLPHSSAAMRSSGVGVSYSAAMPGDIICYSGHVALYMGGGQIVHASNAKDGIKISGNAAYRPILAVRRVL
jgi:cell wall-associated NlpC family hydrolase